MVTQECQTDSGLSDFLPFKCPYINNLSVVVTAYFDESERVDGGEPICLAGYVFRTSAYNRFHNQWAREVLGDRRFAHFHMTDLCAGEKEYKGLSIASRVRILDAAVDAILAHALMGIAVHFNQAEFESLAPSEWPNLFGSTYAISCQISLQMTAKWVKVHGCYDQVVYVFESGHKWQAQAHSTLGGIANDKALRRQFRYRDHRFSGKNEEYGLQAADLLAWTIAKLIALGPGHNSIQHFRPSLQRLIPDEGAHTHLQSFTGETLGSLIRGKVSTPPDLLVNVGPRKRAFR